MYEDWGVRDPLWRGIRSEILRLAGSPVHVLRHDGEADGPTQLLVHGLGGAAGSWLDVIAGLARRGPVVAPDLPGFGRTPPPRRRGSRLGANTAFLRAFAHRLSLTDAHVHASSMGALLGVRLAAADPHRVGYLVLSAPALPVSRAALSRLHPQALRTFAPFAIPGVGASVLRRTYAARTPEELQHDRAAFVHADAEQVREPLRQVGVDTAAYAQRNPWRLEAFAVAAESTVATMLASPPSARRAVEAVTAPTMLLWGDHDRIVPRELVEAVVRRRPDWPLTVLAGVGHAPMTEAPQAYLEAVGAWLDAGAPAALPPGGDVAVDPGAGLADPAG